MTTIAAVAAASVMEHAPSKSSAESDQDRITSDPCRKFQRSFLFLIPALILMCVCAVLMVLMEEAAYATATTFWLLFYILLVNALEAVPNGRHFIPGRLYSRGTVMASVFHQCLLCVAVFTYLCVARSEGTEGGESWWEGLQPWWAGPWREWMEVEQHVFYCIIGYELKDFTRRGLSLGFMVHHIFVFAGCAICLSMPACAGLVVFVGLVAEIGSGFFNLYDLCGPNAPLFVVYFIAMNISNLVGIWALDSLFAHAPTEWAWAYATVVLLLAILRSVGLVLGCIDFVKWLKNKKKIVNKTTPEDNNNNKAETGAKDESTAGHDVELEVQIQPKLQLSPESQQ